MNDQGVYYWGHGKRYNDFSSHFRLVFTEKVQKISIDAGFTCPNRDGSKGFGGCTFCNNETFTPSYCSLGKSIESQINDGIQFFSKKYKDMLYIAYFQSYTNTYASINDLISLYEEALSHPKVIGLVISTRPDCLSAELLDYFERKSKEVYVMVELGVESCENKTLELVNRGHTFEDSIYAIHQLASRKIKNCVHMMLGLPGEDRETILLQSTILSGLPIENLKLHQLQIHVNTKMAKQFMEKPGSFQIFETPEEYAELVVDYLELLHPRIIVERFVSQSPGNMLIAPKWGIKNFQFTAIVERRLQQRNTWQGRLCELV
jgi:radical SAM protein (TIGR01212 family)